MNKIEFQQIHGKYKKVTNHRANSYNKWIENSIEGFNR